MVKTVCSNEAYLKFIYFKSLIQKCCISLSCSNFSAYLLSSQSFQKFSKYKTSKIFHLKYINVTNVLLYFVWISSICK